MPRDRGPAPLMCAAAARARPDRLGLSHQAEADRSTPNADFGGWGEPERGGGQLQQRGRVRAKRRSRLAAEQQTYTIS
jgi:hypothetical protein